MSNNYENLEDQIGMIGAEPAELSATNPKKLKHASIYGQKEELTSDEQKSLDSFLSRSKQRKEEAVEASVSSGWIPINREEMGIGSMFYTAVRELVIRRASA